MINGLRKQKKKSLNSRGLCVLRGVDGTKCAAGFLIPDDKYSPLWDIGGYPEGQSFWDFIEDEGHYAKLVNKVRHIHDHSEIENWEAEFEEVANEFGLIYHKDI